MVLITGEGGKRWAMMFVHVCLSWAHSSAAELSKPKSTREVGGNFTHVQARQGRSLELCAPNGVRCSMSTFFFPKFHAIHCTISTPGAPLEFEKRKLSNGVFRSGNDAVAPKLCLGDPVWTPLP